MISVASTSVPVPAPASNTISLVSASPTPPLLFREERMTSMDNIDLVTK